MADEQGFMTAMGVALASDILDVIVFPPRVLSKILPIPRLIPMNLPHEIGDAISRGAIEYLQGMSILRELSVPIENAVPVAPVHTISVLLGEAEKRIIGQWRPL